MSAERLQKVLARAGVGSRRQVEELIRQGRVTVNGKPAVLGERADLAAAAVKVDGRRIRPAAAERRYVLLNKPRGCVSTLADPEGRPTVIELVPPRLRSGLKPVGRLDFETEGLLLLTDDGDLAHHLTHPRYGCTKTYEVKVKGRPSAALIERLRGGITLDGKRTAPVKIEPRQGPAGHRDSVRNSWWRMVLNEGRTRQIREMFFRIGHPVGRLRRVAIGPLTDAQLRPGEWRQLETREVELLYQRYVSGKAAGRKRSRKPRGPASGQPAHAKPRRPAGRKPRRKSSDQRRRR